MIDDNQKMSIPPLAIENDFFHRTFVNCAMVLKKRLNFFFFQWPKVDQVRNEYSPQDRSYLN
jgi:hypothetical protein